MERVDRSKINRSPSFDYLFSLSSGVGVILFVPFLTNAPPHGAGVIEVFENTKIPSDTCPGQLDSEMRLEGANPLMGKSTVHKVHVLKLPDQVGAILRIIAGLVAEVDCADSGLPSTCDELQNRINHWG